MLNLYQILEPYKKLPLGHKAVGCGPWICNAWHGFPRLVCDCLADSVSSGYSDITHVSKILIQFRVTTWPHWSPLFFFIDPLPLPFYNSTHCKCFREQRWRWGCQSHSFRHLASSIIIAPKPPITAIAHCHGAALCLRTLSYLLRFSHSFLHLPPLVLRFPSLMFFSHKKWVFYGWLM